MRYAKGKTKMTIVQNMQTSDAVRQSYDLLTSIADDLPDDEQRKRFWSGLRNLWKGRLTEDSVPATKPREKMTDEEVESFGHSCMPFGRYKEERIWNVDRSYLEWLDEQNRVGSFRDNLSKYLRSTTD